MLILGTHVASLWRESHNDSRRRIAVVCPVRSWALQKSPECRESPAAAAPAGLWALVLWRGGWTRGIPSGGHSTGAREGIVFLLSFFCGTQKEMFALLFSFKRNQTVLNWNTACFNYDYDVIDRSAGSWGRELLLMRLNLRRSCMWLETWSYGVVAVRIKPRMCTRPSRWTAQFSRYCLQTNDARHFLWINITFSHPF